MNHDQLHEWSRHFDTLLWAMIALVGAGIISLLVYSSGEPNLWMCLGGIVLTNVGVYLTASFRALRRKIHSHLDSTDVEAIRPHKFKQWPALLVVVALLVVAWVSLLQKARPDLEWAWIVVGMSAIGLDIYWVLAADRPPKST